MHEILVSKTVKELRVIAGELKVVGRWEMNKEQLIDSIIKAKKETQKTTRDYLEDVEIGTLVAFTRGRNRNVAMSGKFMGFSEGKVLVESKLGTVFKLSHENIIWVKTGNRWPRWVFSLFGKKESEEE